MWVHLGMLYLPPFWLSVAVASLRLLLCQPHFNNIVMFSSVHVYSLSVAHILSLYLGLFDDDFIEERRVGLEEFINKYDQ